MAAEERWYFTKEQLENTPSKKCGIDPEKELSYRQQAANFIQDMGQRLQVNQLCINTSIVYMHRFYMFHSFQKFHRNAISTCALFLAAKVEEQPRKLEHVIKVAHVCLHRDAPPLDTKSEAYLEQAQELVINENIMLQTLGFDVAIDHPHTHVVKCCQLVRGGWPSWHQQHASKDLAQTSYFMATNSLHLTTMCLQYKPTVVACVCIHLACKWANWEIPKSSEGKRWFWYVEKTVTEELLEELTTEFLAILDRCPSRLKRKMMSSSSGMEKMPDPPGYDKRMGPEFSNASGSNRTSSPSISAVGNSSRSDRNDNFSTALPALVRANLFNRPDGSMSANATDKNGGLGQTSDKKEKHKKEHLNPLPLHTSANSFGSVVQQPSFKHAAATAATTVPPKPSSPDRHGIASSGSPITTDVVPSLLNSSDHSQPPASHTSSPLNTSKKAKLMPKDYREYKERKKRERLEKEKEKPHPSSSDSNQILPNLSGKTERGERECVKGLTIGNTPLSALNLQPVVSLTHLNLSSLAKLTSPQPATPQPGRPRHRTPEKQKSLPIGATLTATPDGGKSRHHHPRGTPEEKAQGPRPHEGNHIGRGHRMKSTNESLGANVPKPPILTPSPPTPRDEEQSVYKPSDITENPILTPPLLPSLEISGMSQSVSKSEHYRKKEKEENVRENRTPVADPLLHPRRHETKDSKDKPIKHHKSKTPPAVAAPQTPPVIAAARPQIPEVVFQQQTTLPKREPAFEAASNDDAALAQPVPTFKLDKDTKHEISRTSASVSHVPLTTPSNVVLTKSPVVKNSSSSLGETASAQDRLHSSLHQTNISSVVNPTETRDKEPDIPTFPSGGAAPPVPEPPVAERQPVATLKFVSHPSKHERREKHRHKDKNRDKERSHDKKEPPVASATPAIRLTIPKERLTLAAGSLGGSSSSRHASPTPAERTSGGLKLKISKDKLVEGSKGGKPNSFGIGVPPLMSTSVAREGSMTTLTPPPPPPPNPTPPKDGGLKIKITKDRLCNFSVGTRDVPKEKFERESRKREREPEMPKAEEPAADPKPPKIVKQSLRSTRRSTDGNPPPLPTGGLLDVPPSSNTRSSRHEQGSRNSNLDGYAPHQQPHMPPQRGRKGMKHGGPMGNMNMPPPHYGHQVNLNPGSFPPYPQYFNYGAPHPPPNMPAYFNAGPMHPGEYPQQFFNQFGPLPHRMSHQRPGMQFQAHPQHMMQQHSMPPLPREPPPVNPPPPPPPE